MNLRIGLSLSLSLVLALVFIAAPLHAGPPGEPLELRVTALPLDPGHPEERRIGQLEYRAGFAITSPWEGFGGLSGMAFLDAGIIAAVSDAGRWSTLRLEHDAAGTLRGITGGLRGTLADERGRALSGNRADAEELLWRGNEGWLVAFERDHRLWRYPAGDGLAGAPVPVSMPEGVRAAEPNRGMEAMVTLPGGKVLMLAEDVRDARGDHTGWIGDPASGDWQAVTLAATDSFVPTGLARLPDGDLVLVERSFNAALFLLRTRLSRIPAAQARPGGRMVTEELARLTPPLTNDNLEAVAARRGPAGETLIYVLSDDNFNTGLQRTLLLQFALAPE